MSDKKDNGDEWVDHVDPIMVVRKKEKQEPEYCCDAFREAVKMCRIKYYEDVSPELNRWRIWGGKWTMAIYYCPFQGCGRELPK